MQILKTIASHDNAKLISGIFFFQVGKGCSRVRRLGKIKFDVRYFHSTIIFCSNF